MVLTMSGIVWLGLARVPCRLLQSKQIYIPMEKLKLLSCNLQFICNACYADAHILHTPMRLPLCVCCTTYSAAARALMLFFFLFAALVLSREQFAWQFSSAYHYMSQCAHYKLSPRLACENVCCVHNMDRFTALFVDSILFIFFSCLFCFFFSFLLFVFFSIFALDKFQHFVVCASWIVCVLARAERIIFIDILFVFTIFACHLTI